MDVVAVLRLGGGVGGLLQRLVRPHFQGPRRGGAGQAEAQRQHGEAVAQAHRQVRKGTGHDVS